MSEVPNTSVCQATPEQPLTAKRLRHEVGLAARYALVGVSATAVHITTVALILNYSDTSPILANTCAFLAAFGISFAGNYYWTFRSPGNPGRALRRFLTISLTAFLMNTLLLTLLVEGQWFSPTVSAICSAALVPAMSFIATRFWGLKPHPAAA